MRIARTGLAMLAAGWLALAAWPAVAGPAPEEVLRTWHQMVLSLTRHTPTYTPPVASRTFAYLGVAAYEAVAAGSDRLESLAGQLNGLTAGPQRLPGAIYDEAIVLDVALAAVTTEMFHNTGPSGQQALAALKDKLEAETTAGVDPAVVARSEAFGAEVAAHILNWAIADGGADIVNMGFPAEGYALPQGPQFWVPTSAIVQQQTPLLPEWGGNRPFVMPSGKTCPTAPALAYSEDPASDFYREALEVYETKNALTPEQAAIARFWSDDPMLSWTPPGHWVSIALQILERDALDLEHAVDLLIRLNVAQADAFIGCWDAKFVYNLIRPLTYIRRVIDPAWETLINTPPFPEYPSGHSTVSGAAALVLTAVLGENFAFEDQTGGRDGLPMRNFASFNEAAEQAALSRLYGGIHFRRAIEEGLAQGRCIGAYAVALRTWK